MSDDLSLLTLVEIAEAKLFTEYANQFYSINTMKRLVLQRFPMLLHCHSTKKLINRKCQKLLINSSMSQNTFIIAAYYAIFNKIPELGYYQKLQQIMSFCSSKRRFLCHLKLMAKANKSSSHVKKYYKCLAYFSIFEYYLYGSRLTK